MPQLKALVVVASRPVVAVDVAMVEGISAGVADIVVVAAVIAVVVVVAGVGVVVVVLVVAVVAVVEVVIVAVAVSSDSGIGTRSSRSSSSSRTSSCRRNSSGSIDLAVAAAEGAAVLSAGTSKRIVVAVAATENEAAVMYEYQAGVAQGQRARTRCRTPQLPGHTHERVP